MVSALTPRSNRACVEPHHENGTEPGLRKICFGDPLNRSLFSNMFVLDRRPVRKSTSSDNRSLRKKHKPICNSRPSSSKRDPLARMKEQERRILRQEQELKRLKRKRELDTAELDSLRESNKRREFLLDEYHFGKAQSSRIRIEQACEYEEHLLCIQKLRTDMALDILADENKRLKRQMQISKSACRQQRERKQRHIRCPLSFQRRTLFVSSISCFSATGCIVHRNALILIHGQVCQVANHNKQA